MSKPLSQEMWDWNIMDGHIRPDEWIVQRWSRDTAKLESKVAEQEADIQRLKKDKRSPLGVELFRYPSVDDGWADGVELSDKNWQFTVGYMTDIGSVIFERRSGFKTEHNSVKAMDAAYQRMQEFIRTQSGEDHE